MKSFRNRDSKVSHIFITTSVFLCLYDWVFNQQGLYSYTANYLESVL